MFTEGEIDRIGRSVEARTLPKCEWTHAAHFAAAMWVLTHPTLVAERDMPASADMNSCSEILPAFTCSLSCQTTVPEPMSRPWCLPLSIGPPLTMMAAYGFLFLTLWMIRVRTEILSRRAHTPVPRIAA